MGQQNVPPSPDVQKIEEVVRARETARDLKELIVSDWRRAALVVKTLCTRNGGLTQAELDILKAQGDQDVNNLLENQQSIRKGCEKIAEYLQNRAL